MNIKENEELLHKMLKYDEINLKNVKIYSTSENELDPYNNSEAQQSYGYVYEIVNNINGKTYIGCRKLSKDNGDWHKYYGSGKNIIKAIEKYGRENFSKKLVCYATDERTLFKLEWTIIRTAKRNESGAQYNIFNGAGAGGDTFKYLKEEELKAIRKKQSEGLKKAYSEGRIINGRSETAKNKSKTLWDEFSIEIIDEYLRIGSMDKINRHGISRKILRQFLDENGIKINSQNISSEISAEAKILRSTKIKEYYRDVSHIDKNRYNCIICFNSFFSKKAGVKYCSNCSQNNNRNKVINLQRYHNELNDTYIFTNECIACHNFFETFNYCDYKCENCFKIRAKTKLQGNVFNYDSLYELYVEKGMHVNDIAEYYECKYRTIYNALKNYGIDLKDPKRQIKLNSKSK